MRDENYKEAPTVPEELDHHWLEFVERPQYELATLICLLCEGRFIVEGKESTWETAELVLQEMEERRMPTAEGWKALRAWELDIDQPCELHELLRGVDNPVF